MYELRITPIGLELNVGRYRWYTFNHMQRLRRLLILLLPLVLLVVLWFQRFAILDWWRLRNYEPPARIVQLADDTKMTDLGRKLFYVNHPELNDKSSFNQNCTISEQSIVLGCYISGQGIYLFDVADERLQGVHEVTAAHEMLHAAYDRLSGSERKRVDGLTQGVLNGLTEERILATIETYRQRDPGVIPNELHSILATEVAKLPAELEDYYKKYFADRQVVVEYSRDYESAFEERKAKVANYDAELTQLKLQIDNGQESLNRLAKELGVERQRLDALLADQQFDAYNSGVPAFNARVRDYNATVNEVRNLIDRYNQMVADRNAVAHEESELIQAIDSRPDTLPSE